MELKPRNAIDNRAKVINVIGIPLNESGTGEYSSFSMIAEMMVITNVNPIPAPKLFKIEYKKE